MEQGLSPTELEVVVVDDGSTDKTPEIIQKFAPRVKHIRKANGGQASAFNAGFPPRPRFQSYIARRRSAGLRARSRVWAEDVLALFVAPKVEHTITGG